MEIVGSKAWLLWFSRHVAILLWPALAGGLSVGVTVAPEFGCLWFLALTTSSFPGMLRMFRFGFRGVSLLEALRLFASVAAALVHAACLVCR